MREAVYQTTRRRRFSGPPELVWAFVSDTNRFDRTVGLRPSTYSYEVSGSPPARRRVGRSRFWWHTYRFLEVGEWEEGRGGWGERRFLGSYIPRAGLKFRVEPAGDATELTISVYAVADSLWGHMVAMFWKGMFAIALARYLVAVDKLLASWRDVDPEGPAVARARAILLGARVDSGVEGRFSRLHEDVLARRAERFAQTRADDAVRAKLLEHLRTRHDDEVRLMRPFELARVWGLDRRQVLRGFLHAAKVGLVDLHWQLNCPSCRVGARVESTLAEVGRRVHCDACDIGFDTDFADNVEVVFDVNPGVRAVRPEVYCSGSPFFRPHVTAQLVLQPGEERGLTGLPDGEYLLRLLGARLQRRLPQPLAAVARVGATAIELAPGEPGLRLVNEAAAEVTLLVERADWSSDIVRGSLIVTMPDFVELFGTEAPAAGVDLYVGTMCIVFSDLVGSTALYERIGESRAYALVQEHFAEACEAIARHDGAVVKTLGDGIMACFARPGDALAAAMEMSARADELGRAREVSMAIRVGVHQGPCYVVRANERMDLFGTAVNVAARLQRVAGPGQTVATTEVLAHDTARRVLGQRHATVRRLQAPLRGLSGSYDLAVIDVAARATAGAATPS